MIRIRYYEHKADFFLAHCIQLQDLDWFLDLCFSQPYPYLHYTPSRFPYTAMQQRIERESQSPLAKRRQTALHLALHAGEYPATHAIFEQLSADSDSIVRRDATYFLTTFEGKSQDKHLAFEHATLNDQYWLKNYRKRGKAFWEAYSENGQIAPQREL